MRLKHVQRTSQSNGLARQSKRQSVRLLSIGVFIAGLGLRARSPM